MNPELHAKITVPSLPHLLLDEQRRAGLYHRMQQSPLILLCTPAGYGKTTLASAYCQRSKVAACWYALDEADNEGVVFGRYLVASLQRQAMLSPALLQRASTGLYQSLGELMREVLLQLQDRSEPLILVLDDFHLLHQPAVLDALQLFIRYRPPCLQVLLITRIEPPSLQRLLLSQQTLLRVSASELQLDEHAVQTLFSHYGHSISTSSARRLHQRAEGWITGLKLIALNHGHSALEGSDVPLQGVDIRNYLFHEVYARLDPPLQHFLVCTSIVERFNPELARVLSGIPQLEPLFQAIEQQQLFMSRSGDDGGWFRYHPLLAEFLRGRLDDPAQYGELHARAARWWQDGGQLHMAARHYAASGGATASSTFLLDHGWTLFNSGHGEALSECLRSLPPAQIAANLHLCSMQAWLEYVLRRRPRRVLPLLHAAEAALLQTLPAPAAAQQMLALLGSIRASVLLEAGDKDEASIIANAALLQWRHDPHSIKCAAIHSVLSDIALDNGDLPTALGHSQQAARLDRSHQLYLGVFWHLHQQAVLACCRGELHSGRQLLDAAMAVVKEQGLGYLPRYDYWLRSSARLCWLRLQLQQAQQHVDMAVSHNRSWPHEQLLNQIWLCQIALARHDAASIAPVLPALEGALHDATLAQGPRAELHHLLTQLWVQRQDLAALLAFAESTPVPSAAPNPCTQMQCRSLARARLALQQLTAASQVLQIAIDSAAASGLLADLHQAALLQCAVLWQQGRPDAALALLDAALLWIAAQDAPMLVLMQQDDLVAPLQAIEQHGSPPARHMATRLLQLLRQRHSRTRRGHSDLPDVARAHGLTPQEWQLLQLVAASLGNEEICDRLHVSMNTVRSHIRRLNRKLGIGTRSEAVELGLALLQRSVAH